MHVCMHVCKGLDSLCRVVYRPWSVFIKHAYIHICMLYVCMHACMCLLIAGCRSCETILLTLTQWKYFSLDGSVGTPPKARASCGFTAIGSRLFVFAGESKLVNQRVTGETPFCFAVLHGHAVDALIIFVASEPEWPPSIRSGNAEMEAIRSWCQRFRAVTSIQLWIYCSWASFVCIWWTGFTTKW